MPHDWKRIDIEGLEFSYARNCRDTPMLNGVSLTLNRGETIALVGPSGSGKSTLMRVLAGLYDPNRGLNLLQRFDRVMLMDDGMVVDSGSVTELLERQPLFRELWNRSLSPEASALAA